MKGIGPPPLPPVNQSLLPDQRDAMMQARMRYFMQPPRLDPADAPDVVPSVAARSYYKLGRKR